MSSPHIVRDGECDGIKWSVRYEPAFCGYFYLAVLGNYEYTSLEESCSEFQLHVFLEQARIAFEKVQRKEAEGVDFLVNVVRNPSSATCLTFNTRGCPQPINGRLS